MKFLTIILVSILSVQAMGYEIPLVADIDWKCEEGLGNLDNPARLLDIVGEFETTASREFSLAEKQKMTVTVYADGKPTVLNSSDYRLLWENDGDFQTLTIQIGDSTYKISTTSGNALILRITKPGWLWGTRTEVGSC
ncbi:MAG: hypothetical protein M9899_02485 [Bdellovibrionaceae bacterium]|nr:hypothetical protein [Pseudobdellovibrionaceae bacterium]